jgi:hypothetical protein
MALIRQKDNPLTRQVPSRREHQNLLLQVARKKRTLDIKSVNKKSMLTSERKKEAKRSRLAGWSVFELKVETIGMTKTLGTDSGLELHNLVVRPELLLVGPGGRDGVVVWLGGGGGDDLPYIVEDHVCDLNFLRFLPFLTVISGHCLSMTSWLRGSDRKGNHSPGADQDNVIRVDRDVDTSGMGTQT